MGDEAIAEKPGDARWFVEMEMYLLLQIARCNGVCWSLYFGLGLASWFHCKWWAINSLCLLGLTHLLPVSIGKLTSESKDVGVIDSISTKQVVLLFVQTPRFSQAFEAKPRLLAFSLPPSAR
jgi:hypothetical protein